MQFHRALLYWLATAFTAAAADNIDITVNQYFRPYQRDLATMSPDGKHVALTDEVRRGQASIVVVDLDDHSSRSFYVGERADHAVEQMQWVSSTQLVFTTRSRGVGALDLAKSAVAPLLLSSDLDIYAPEPVLGPRSLGTAMVTPDMPAEANASHGVFAGDRHRVTLADALAYAGSSGDLFGPDAQRGAGRALRPYLLGAKPGSATTVLVELRSEADLFEYSRAEGGECHGARQRLPDRARLAPAGVDQ